MKKILALSISLVLIFALVLTGCSESKTGDYAVKVNGQEISKKLFEERVKGIQDYLEKQGMDFTTEQGKQMLESLQNDVLEGMISAELIKQEIADKGWDANSAEVDEEMSALKERLGDKDYDEWLKEQAMSDEDVRNFFTFNMNIGKDVTVTEGEVNQYFEANFAQYGGQPEQVKARHILVETEEEAKEVISQLRGGADFAEIAKEKSLEEAAQSTGGDLGYFDRSRMVPEFTEPVFQLELNEISDPIQSRFGYHVVQVLDRKQEIRPDFEEVKEKVKEDALAFAKNQKVQSYYSKIREEAELEYAEGYKPKAAE